MQELNQSEIDAVSGGLTAAEGAGLILATAALCLTPITIGVAIGAAGGLILADVMAY